jgi:hypothetical protein
LIVDFFLLKFEFYVIELFYPRGVITVLEQFRLLKDVQVAFGSDARRDFTRWALDQGVRRRIRE